MTGASHHADVIFRLDAGRGIGTGHVMRCATVADELRAIGLSSRFLVSGRESYGVLSRMGLQCDILGGNPLSLGSRDGEALTSMAKALGARAIIVDTYGVTDAFFEGMRQAKANTWTLYFDDKYTFDTGRMKRPVPRPVDAVVDYMLGARTWEYEEAYESCSSTVLMVGTRYAPVRPQFSPPAMRDYGEVRRVLVTSGSTNPDCALERMIDACPLKVRIDVVVGAQSSIDKACLGGRHAVVHKGLSDLSDLMRNCDVAVSSGGTTVLELLSTGIPSAVVAIVENQKENVEGLRKEGLGVACCWDDSRQGVFELCGDPNLRKRLSEAGMAAVDRRGAQRIASEVASHIRIARL